MSKFSVDIRRIEKVWDHPNADRLSLAKVEGLGFQFVTGKDLYKVGDYVVYFPLDSVLPPHLLRAFGLEGKLSGKEKNRISTVKLRGEISQGFVAPVAEVEPLCQFEGNANDLHMYIRDEVEADDAEALSHYNLAPSLGVTKYEQPPIPCHAGNLVRLPEGVSVYDIEGAERYPHIMDLLMDQRVWITEKVEGQNYGVTSREGEIIVNQRKAAIEPVDGKEHSLWAATRKQGLDELVENLRVHLGATQVTLRGEYFGPGVQKNVYKLTETGVRLFDVLADGRYLTWNEIREFDETVLSTMWAPLIAHNIVLRDWLGKRTIVEASGGPSLLNPITLREGIVIKPLEEQTDPEIGRVIIKQRDPVYLAKHGF